VLLALLFFGWSWLRQLPAGKRRQAVISLLCILLVGVLLVLAATGRIHWVGALLGALIPLGRGAFKLALQFLPLWQQRRANRAPPSDTGNDNIGLDEALLTLGVKDAYQAGTLTTAQVEAAYKRLIQKLHPDRGGNDYLASRINAAKARVILALGS
jgi:hypothetical protein